MTKGYLFQFRGCWRIKCSPTCCSIISVDYSNFLSHFCFVIWMFGNFKCHSYKLILFSYYSGFDWTVIRADWSSSVLFPCQYCLPMSGVISYLTAITDSMHINFLQTSDAIMTALLGIPFDVTRWWAFWNKPIIAHHIIIRWVFHQSYFTKVPTSEIFTSSRNSQWK